MSHTRSIPQAVLCGLLTCVLVSVTPATARSADKPWTPDPAWIDRVPAKERPRARAATCAEVKEMVAVFAMTDPTSWHPGIDRDIVRLWMQVDTAESYRGVAIQLTQEMALQHSRTPLDERTAGKQAEAECLRRLALLPSAPDQGRR
jgi:hypothetical protein